MKGKHNHTLTEGSITPAIIRFALPFILGNLLQQCYNITDTFIVGRILGPEALAAAGSSYALMIFVTSIFIGLCMGSGSVISMLYGGRQHNEMKQNIFASIVIIGTVTLTLNVIGIAFLKPIIRLLQTPPELFQLTYDYLFIIFCGMLPICIYNFYAFMLRAIGDSTTPLIFLALSVVLNILLDLLFIIGFNGGIKGAAWATVISQSLAALTLMLYTNIRFPQLHLKKEDLKCSKTAFQHITAHSLLTCTQQSVMNFGILLVQGLVNSFGTAIMAAFAAAVKIDSFAYMPVQDFGNAFSTFIAQNFGAKQTERIRKGMKSAFLLVSLFSITVSFIVYITAPQLMGIFVQPEHTDIIQIGAEYLRIEGSFYIGIGWLFLLYGIFRAIDRPAMSLVLTIISLGTRVILAYTLAPIPAFSYHSIWWSVPIGWFLADFIGFIVLLRIRRKVL